MAFEDKKKLSRKPLSQKEVANLVAIKKHREQQKVIQFKKTNTFKFFNIFNVCCFFIYLELLFCFFGPINYQTHYSISVKIKTGNEINLKNERIISQINIVDASLKQYDLIIDDYVLPPKKFTAFQIGKDYIIQKELKAKICDLDKDYFIQSSSPILFLLLLIIFVSIISVIYNLNENIYSLCAVSLLNIIIMFSFLIL